MKKRGNTPVEIPKFKDLTQIKTGLYELFDIVPWLVFFTKRVTCGWLEIEHLENGDTVLFWTNKKDRHVFMSGDKAKGLTLHSNGEIRQYIESIFSMHLIWDGSQTHRQTKRIKKAARFAQWTNDKLANPAMYKWRPLSD